MTVGPSLNDNAGPNISRKFSKLKKKNLTQDPPPLRPPPCPNHLLNQLPITNITAIVMMTGFFPSEVPRYTSPRLFSLFLSFLVHRKKDEIR